MTRPGVMPVTAELKVSPSLQPAMSAALTTRSVELDGATFTQADSLASSVCSKCGARDARHLVAEDQAGTGAGEVVMSLATLLIVSVGGFWTRAASTSASGRNGVSLTATCCD